MSVTGEVFRVEFENHNGDHVELGVATLGEDEIERFEWANDEGESGIAFVYKSGVRRYIPECRLYAVDWRLVPAKTD